jgi:DNA modification methylase
LENAAVFDLVKVGEIPADWVANADDLTEEQQQEFIVKDNVGFGSWDWDALANEWDAGELAEWGLDLPGMEEEAELLEAAEDDYEEPEQMQIDVVEGDLIEIGQHRLLCGDSTNSDDVARLMNGEKADLAHNDPPYGMKKEKEGVANDNLNFDDLLDFNREWIALQFDVIKENGSFYCWGIDEPLMDIYSHILKPYIKAQKATFRNLITWDKGNGQGQKAKEFRSFAIADEKCLFAMMGVQGFNNNADNYFQGWEEIRLHLFEEFKKMKITRKQLNEILGSSPKSSGGLVSHYFDKAQWSFIPLHQYIKIQNYCKKNEIIAFEKEYDELKKEYDELKKEYYSTRAYFDNTHDNMNNVWHFKRTSSDERQATGNHATPKPIELCERVIKSSCAKNGLVIDFFLGSGSTMVAAHQINRRCFGLELSPKYCQVIIDRMHKLDQNLEIKINGEVYEPKTEVAF